MKTRRISRLAGAALALAGLATPAAIWANEPITNIPSAQLDWETTPEGVAFAALIGDRFAEPYMAMVRLPGGLASPPHIKTANMFGVVVSGTMTHVAVGADAVAEVPLPVGSFYRVPAGLAHVSTCLSQVECITFLYQDGKFDFLPVSQ